MKKIIDRVNKLLHSEYFLLTLIVLTAFVVRLYKINSPIADWHSWRQADTASVTRIYVQKGINLFMPRYYDISSIQSGIENPQGYRFVEFPIFNLIHYFFNSLSSKLSLETWGRLTSVFASLVSIVLIYLIGKKTIGGKGGLLASFFFAFIPFNIYFSRVILPEPLAVTFALFALWLFIKYIDNEKFINLLLSGIFMSLALLIKPYIFFYVLPMVYLAINKYGFMNLFKIRRNLIRFFVFAAILFVPLIVWRVWSAKFPEGIPFVSWAFNGDRIRFRFAFWRWIFAERIGNLILGIWGLPVFVLGLISKKKNYTNLVFMFAAILYLTIVATASVRHDYYQIFVIPAISLLLAEGAIYIWESINFNKWIARPLLFLSLFIMFGVGAYQIKEFYKINYPEMIMAGKDIDALVPKDALIIAPYNGDTAFLYQTNRFGWPAIDDSIENIIKKGASYYVSLDQGSPDTKYVLGKYQTVKKTPQYVIVNLTKLLK